MILNIKIRNLIGGPSGLKSRDEELQVKEELRSFAASFITNMEKFSKTKVVITKLIIKNILIFQRILTKRRH